MAVSFDPSKGRYLAYESMTDFVAGCDDLERLLSLLVSMCSSTSPEFCGDVCVWDFETDDVVAVVQGNGRVVRFHLDTSLLGRLHKQG